MSYPLFELTGDRALDRRVAVRCDVHGCDAVVEDDLRSREILIYELLLHGWRKLGNGRHVCPRHCGKTLRKQR